MRIGLITGEFPPMQGGVGDFSRELAIALTDLGHEVHVITRVGCTADGPPPRERNGDGPAEGDTPGASHLPWLRGLETHLTVHPVVHRWGWRSLDHVTSLARHLTLDVLNVQYQAAAFDLQPAINFLPWRVGFAPVRRRTPYRPIVVVTFHDLKVPYLFPKAGSLRNWVVTFLARCASAAIATNRADELELIARRVRRVERIPIGSNIAPSLPEDYDRRAWRAKLGIGSDDCVLGFFGFLNARKGVETLIRALVMLQQAQDASLNACFHLLFIGGTVGSSDATNRAYADFIKKLIADLGLNERVHYTGYVPTAQVSAAFAAVDLCVLPYADGISFHHGTLMAALAHGRPIVSTLPQLKLPELVHGENVWLVPRENPGALAAGIATLAADSEGRQRLARGAAELSAQFSWPAIAARTSHLFSELERGI